MKKFTVMFVTPRIASREYMADELMVREGTFQLWKKAESANYLVASMPVAAVAGVWETASATVADDK